MVRILGVVCFILLSKFSWAQETDDSKVAASLTVFELSSTSKNEIKDFDMDTIIEYFQDNEPDQEITVSFELVEKNSKRKKVTSSSKKITWKGKTQDLKDVLPEIKEQVKTL